MLEKLLKPEYEVNLICNDKEKYAKARGSTPSLLTALSTFVNALKENGIDEKIINYAVKQGLLTDKELQNETKKNLQDFMNKLFN